MQTFKPWLPIQEPPQFLGGVFVLQHHAGSVTVACDGKFNGGKLLVLRFKSFEAVTTHEEFAHQWPGESGQPELPKSPGGFWTFPFLEVENSVWAANSMKAVTFGIVPTHYCIISGSDIVDVLAVDPPEIAWATVAEVESVMQAAKHLGAA
jgi:hypothetical protein